VLKLDSYSNLYRIGEDNFREYRVINDDFRLAHFNSIENPTIENRINFSGNEFVRRRALEDWAIIRNQPVYIEGISINNPETLEYDFRAHGFGLKPIPMNGYPTPTLIISTRIPFPPGEAESFKKSLNESNPIRLFMILKFEKYEYTNLRVCNQRFSDGQCIHFVERPFRNPVYSIEHFVIMRRLQLLYHSN